MTDLIPDLRAGGDAVKALKEGDMVMFDGVRFRVAAITQVDEDTRSYSLESSLEFIPGLDDLIAESIYRTYGIPKYLVSDTP